MRRYPPDWQVVRLADTGRWLSGGTPSTLFSRYWDGDIPWISAASLKNFDIADSDRKVSQLGATSGTRIVPQGTVLFVVRGMSLKSEFRIGVTKREMTFGQDCKAILPAPNIDARFLAYSLKANAGRVLAMVDEAGHGTGRLPTDQLAALELGIPTYNEQRRIAEILGSMDESISSTQRIVTKLYTMRASLLAVLFQVESWESVALAHVASISSGGTPSRSIASFWHGGTVPWVKTGEVNFSRIKDTEERITPTAVSASRLRVYPAGTVLTAMYGQGATRGRVGILAIPATINQACAAIQCDPKVMRQEYLYHQLTHSYKRLRRLGHGSQQTNLNAELLGQLTIKVPSLDEQDRAVRQVGQLDARLESERTMLRKLSSLRQALMTDLLAGRVRVKVERA